MSSIHKRLKILVFPCGAENAMEIFDALRYSVHAEVFGASSVEDHGRYVFDNYIGSVPNINAENFDAAFSKIISEREIDLVFATHDSVIEHLSVRAPFMGFYLVNGDPQTTAIARSKSATYKKFSAHAWAPRFFSTLEEIDQWPAIIKPDRGQGGQNVQLVHSLREARLCELTVENPVWMENLPGKELTVDCFTDREGILKWCSARTRERVKAGISMHSRFLSQEEEIESIAADINRQVNLRGPWFFQVKQDAGGCWKLLEFSCRVSGTMVAQRARGVNLPLMALHDYLGRSVSAMPMPCIKAVDRRISTKALLDHEYHTVFMDLDDTLVIAGSAVPIAMAFVYQEISKGKKIILITRHEGDVLAELHRAKIHEGIFEKIIHIDDKSHKSQYVHESSIFVDNHFPERSDVFLNCQVPAFDLDALEFLMR
ncbi:ATP-grasp domain-containing protein [Comamonas composti]|uniref:ATP-grasp domain-containing protein n=1 Tax=Comamonas composti TaxID=408558 RepID=UPI00040D18E5|nr:ATP-grasp domain-containing protein [Comamonas composti]